jgi:hypothetical protein
VEWSSGSSIQTSAKHSSRAVFIGLVTAAQVQTTHEKREGALRTASERLESDDDET